MATAASHDSSVAVADWRLFDLYASLVMVEVLYFPLSELRFGGGGGGCSFFSSRESFAPLVFSFFGGPLYDSRSLPFFMLILLRRWRWWGLWFCLL